MSAAPAEPFEVDDLDAAGVLDAISDADRAERRAAVEKLALAYHWAVLHPATEETGVATPGGPALDVLFTPESLGGEGTPAVAAFAPEPLAVRLGITPSSAGALIGDALDLVHRHPLLWRKVERLLVPAWQARRVAQQTRRLPLTGARWVDEQLASRGDDACGPVIVHRLVAQLTATADPESQQEAEEAAQAGWDVTISHADPALFAGTSHLDLDGDTATLQEMHDLVVAIAHQLWLDGDESPLGVATMARLRQWVGHHQITFIPVLNMQRGDAVDVHDPPLWMRELVILRDGHCVFPRCTRDARSCDLDHITPYVPDGSPGQTRPDNLACLCRRHHRAKTSGLWRYTRTPDGDYRWRGPYGTTYLVTSRGSLRQR